MTACSCWTASPAWASTSTLLRHPSLEPLPSSPLSKVCCLPHTSAQRLSEVPAAVGLAPPLPVARVFLSRAYFNHTLCCSCEACDSSGSSSL